MKEAQVSTVNLPRPISANKIRAAVRLKKGGARIVDSLAYVNWKVEAGYKLNSQHPAKVPGYFGLYLQIEDGLGIDLDNSVKAAMDALQNGRVIENDKFCRFLEVKWSSEVEGMRAMVVATKGPTNEAGQ